MEDQVIYRCTVTLLLPIFCNDMLEIPENRQALEKIMFLIIAMLQNGVGFYEISDRLVNPCTSE